MSALLRSLADPAARQIRRWVLDAFPRGQSGIDYDHPRGDPGLFGPDSVTWRVHAELPGMLAGGLCALMLQTLHPLALAGVYDHSNFRDDLVGRLRRTTNFVAGTSYAPEGQALRLIERVRSIHARVRGALPDGRRYAADAPELLTWVHVTESYGFLEGFRRYGRDVTEALADRYYDEVRRVAEALGATQVPASQAEVAAYFERMRPELQLDARSREVLAILSAIRLPVPLPGVSRDVFLGAGAALLPGWARTMLGDGIPGGGTVRMSSALMRAMAPLFRSALDDGVAQRACSRMSRAPDLLERWPAAHP